MMTKVVPCQITRTPFTPIQTSYQEGNGTIIAPGLGKQPQGNLLQNPSCVPGKKYHVEVNKEKSHQNECGLNAEFFGSLVFAYVGIWPNNPLCLRESDLEDSSLFQKLPFTTMNPSDFLASLHPFIRSLTSSTTRSISIIVFKTWMLSNCHPRLLLSIFVMHNL